MLLCHSFGISDVSKILLYSSLKYLIISMPPYLIISLVMWSGPGAFLFFSISLRRISLLLWLKLLFVMKCYIGFDSSASYNSPKYFSQDLISTLRVCTYSFTGFFLFLSIFHTFLWAPYISWSMSLVNLIQCSLLIPSILAFTLFLTATYSWKFSCVGLLLYLVDS